MFRWPLCRNAFIVLAVCASLSATAEVTTRERTCLGLGDSSWSEVEKWVWSRICANETADLSVRDGRTLDPESEDGWDEQRLLSPEFLENILLLDPWKSAVPRRGVRIIGAKFDAPLVFDESQIDFQLWLDASRLLEPVSLKRLVTQSLISFEGSHFLGEIDMNSAVVGGNLFMRFGAKFSDLSVQGAKIGGQLSLNESSISGTLNLNSSDIGGHLLIRDGQFDTPIDGTFLRVGGNLDLRGSDLASLDLTGANIKRELRLATPEWVPEWRDDARLILRNMTVDALQDTPDAWPHDLDLDGFVYRTLGGLGSNLNVTERGSDWYVEWLARDSPYTPQPYAQLARVLTQMGHGTEAGDVLYAGEERSRALAKEKGHWVVWAGQTALKYTIGYGLGTRYFRSLYWVFGLVLVGTLLLHLSEQNRVAANDDRPEMHLGFFYSLDMLLPIIRLRERHYEVDLRGYVRYYFYFHQIMGYVLASFLIAGLSGITK